MIDHSAHPHPSTPAARALCRANGGTGATAKTGVAVPKTSSAQKKTPVRPPVSNHSSSLAGSKVTDVNGKSSKKSTTPAVKKSTTPAVKKTPMTAEKHANIMAKMSDVDEQEKVLRSVPVGIDGDDDRGFSSDEEKDAATGYIASGYGFINSFLRGQNQGNEKTKEDIKHLRSIMSRSKTSEDVGVFRGVGRGRVLFGDSLDGDMTGLEWREKGFSSTTVNEDVADDFTDGGDDDDDQDTPIKMRIVLPQGTSAFQASDIDDEAEMIVDENSAYRVIKDRGEDDNGVRILDIQLLLG